LSRREVIAGGIAAPSQVTAEKSAPPLWAAFDQHLADLTAAYNRQAAAVTQAFRKAYPHGREQWSPAPGESGEDLQRRLVEHEAATGIAAADDALDAAFDRVQRFCRQIIAWDCGAPEALAVKARACLWCAPAEALDREGFELVADFLKSLLPRA